MATFRWPLISIYFMDVIFNIFNKVCVLVTAASALTLVPGFRRSERSLLSMRDRGSALLVFLILGLVEEAATGQTSWFNHRIVAVCAAGLLSGPGVGAVVAAFMTSIPVILHGRSPVVCGIAMFGGGLIGGCLFRLRPKLAQHPMTGFCLTLGISLLRNGLVLFYVPGALTATELVRLTATAPVLQGLGTALILAVIAQVRDHDEKTRAAAAAEVRALQARMDPHFLFNTLNTLAALATVAPREIPRAAGRLRHFLRASFDQHERDLVPLGEELAVVRAYLEIESLQLGNRLKVEETIDPGLSDALVPPFSLQPLVENAVQHGLQSSPNAGRLHLVVVRRMGDWLDISISDDGPGVPATEVERVFFAARPRVHALTLLRRRLQGLFDRSFRLEVKSEVGRGTTVRMRVPLRRRFDIAEESLEAGRSEPGHPVSC